VIDGAEQEVLACSEKTVSKATFSGKKNYHTFTKLLVVSPKGKIYFVSRSFPGSMNDLNLMTLTENWKHLQVSTDEVILADDGFKGYAEQNIWTTSTETSKSSSPSYRSDFKAIRVIVENAISQVKKWKICSTLWKVKVKDLDKALEKHHKMWTICVGMVNRFISLRD
jgi:hypothetical protein